MPESPKRPYSLATAHGRIRVWGGEGERGEGKPEGEVGGAEELTEDQKVIKEAQQKAEEAETKAKDAEKRAKDAEKALQDKEREGMEDTEKLKADHDDLQQRYEKLLKFVETTAIDTAILQISGKKDKDGNPAYDWHNPTALRALLNREELNIDLDNQAVDGLEAQLKSLAKDQPYLLVSKEERDESAGYTPPDQRGTGNHPNGGSPRPRETDRQKLAGKYKFGHLVGGPPR